MRFRYLATVFLAVFAVLLTSASPTASAQSLEEFEDKVTQFTLDNGLQFVVIERHDAPVVSFHTYVNAGAVDDPKGQTGMAHMFEHMAFKGTPDIGSKNWEQESRALEAIEEVYDQLENERNKAFRADPDEIARLEGLLDDAIATADALVESNEYDTIVESNGGVGMNAGTGEDATQYFYSFPSNKIELWFLLESERFLRPVMREFYKERDVVREERRMRVESSPQGQLIESALAAAFDAHPYHNWAGGWPSDIENFRATEARKFFETYYSPSNLTIGIAGDVDPVEARAMAEKYFGRIPAGDPAPLVRTEEPPQLGEKRVKVASAAQPLLLVGYKRPDQYSPDAPALEILAEVLTGGRTGIMYREMVQESQISLGVQAVPEYPGSKYPSLYILFTVPSPNSSVEENEAAFYEIVERIKSEPVDPAAVERVKTRLRAAVIQGLASNSGLAGTLAAYQAGYGDWRRLFTQLEDYNAVTPEDLQRVAQKYLVEESRTVAYTYAPDAPQGGNE